MHKKSFNIEDAFLWFIVGFGVLGMSAVVIGGIVSQGACPTHQTRHVIERPVTTETTKTTTKPSREANSFSMESCQCIVKEEHTICTCPNTIVAKEEHNHAPETTGEKVTFFGSMGALALAALLFI